MKAFYRQKTPIDIENLPNIDRDKYPTNSDFAAVKFTKGCPYDCEFCSIAHRKFGKVYRKKSIEKVIEDVKSIKQRYIFIADPNLTIDVEYTKDILKHLKSMNKKFVYCQANINVLGEDDELLRLARDAGFVEWHVGFESVSSRALQSTSKKTNRVDNYLKSIKKVNDYGMSIVGEFVFGFDTDTIDIFERTKNVIKDWDIQPGFQVLIPYPGSPLFNRLLKDGRILTRDWSRYNIWEVVFQPKNMSPKELNQGVMDMWKNFYSYKHVLKRSIKNLKFGPYQFLWRTRSNLAFASTLTYHQDS